MRANNTQLKLLLEPAEARGPMKHNACTPSSADLALWPASVLTGESLVSGSVWTPDSGAPTRGWGDGMYFIPRPLTRHPRKPVSPRPPTWPLTSRSHSTVPTLSLHLSLYSGSSLPTETSEPSSKTHFPASSPPSTHAPGISSLGALALEPTACLSHPIPTPPSQGHNSQALLRPYHQDVAL